MRNIFFSLIVIASILLPFYLKAEERSDSVRVLFIGNSYTHYHDLPEMVKQIASNAGMHEKMKIASTSFTPPSRLGTYLAANVIYTTMLGKPYQSTWTDNLDSELAEYIQQVAQQTVFDNKDLLNIK